MNRSKWVATGLGVLMIGLVVWSGSAFAGKGMGHFPMGTGTPPCVSALSPEQQKQFTELQQKFLNETQGLRQQIAEKRAALNLELTKANPDVSNAQGIQKELSALEAEMAQKNVAHMIEMKQICPSLGTGRGMGMMHGGRMGMGYMGAAPGAGPAMAR